jgi:uncharacterized protein YbjT (DUF2867 family)
VNKLVSIAMIGASGAVGGACVKALTALPAIGRITLLGRRMLEGVSDGRISQFVVDLDDPLSYRPHLADHDTAICTLGIGQPSKASREEFIRIDHDMPLKFAQACEDAGVGHFQLLSSVATNPKSRSFYLRSKGELEAEIAGTGFGRVSIFQPSMILTPTNRYGWTQGLTLAVWPWLNPVLVGSLRKYRGIKVADLGAAIANNCVTAGAGVERLEWDGIVRLAKA